MHTEQRLVVELFWVYGSVLQHFTQPLPPLVERFWIVEIRYLPHKLPLQLSESNIT